MHQICSRSLGRFAVACLLLLTLSILPAGRATAATAFDCTGFTCIDVSFTGGDGLTLHGTVIGPPAPHTRTPGIVLVAGAGAGPRTEYQSEARAFAAAGITTLVYDKRTTGYSFAHRDISLLAGDALGAVETLRRTPGVRADQVGLWGFSEGAWAAPLAASRSRGVAFLITLGASGFSPLRSQTWSLATTLRHRGATGSLAATIAGPTARLLGETGAFPEADFDPLPALRALRIPVLALWGQHDVQVPPAESAAVLRNTLTASPSVTIRFLRGGAHNGRSTTDGFDRLGTPPYSGAPRGAFVPGYFDTMTDWVQHITAGSPPVSSADAPPHQTILSVDPGRGRWISARMQLTVLSALILGFAGYLLWSLTDRRSRATRTRSRLARTLACSGLVSVFATVLYVVSILAFDAQTVGPIVAARPLIWLGLQVLALLTTALLAATAIATARAHAGSLLRHRIALSILLLVGCLWLAWATTWGLPSV
ncbi:alpha/beta hydrolase family protein [Nocardia jiangxiensis]|uniref:alpha/beta hydrolase family protein n=1 Tax=Nocardia jiangxiensis TaxID=282685 RepID=UPI0002F08EAC|nr:alpha/beta hydrolase [Nocardia jiangxiensis]